MNLFSDGCLDGKKLSKTVQNLPVPYFFIGARAETRAETGAGTNKQ